MLDEFANKSFPWKFTGGRVGFKNPNTFEMIGKKWKLHGISNLDLLQPFPNNLDVKLA